MKGDDFIEADLRDLPTRELLLKYKEQFAEIDIESVLLCLNFQKASRDITKRYDQFIATYELSEARFTLLMLLNREDSKSLTAGELAKKLGVKKATMTGLMAGLEHSGLAIRSRDELDQRSIRVTLTAQGIAKLMEVLPFNYREATRVFAMLSSQEKEMLNELLQKILGGNDNEQD